MGETKTDWIWEVDENSIYTYVGSQIREVLGYEPEEVLGRTPFEFMSPEEADRVKKICAPLAAANKPFSLIENICIHKNGQPVFIETSGVPFFDGDGKFRGYHGIDRDITRRKQTEEKLENAIEKLKEEKAKSEAIIAGIGDGITIQDADYKIMYENQVQKDLFGDHVGEYCYKSYMNGDTVCDGCPVHVTFRDGIIHKAERSSYIRGEKRYFEITSSPLRDSEGNILAAIKVVRDITDRKQAEEELLNHREHLAELVRDQTLELTTTIELLRDEINERRHSEEALLESERRYRGLFNCMSSGVAVFEAREKGKNFVFRDFNQAGEGIDNIKKEDVIGKKVTDVFPGIKKTGLFKVFQRVWKTGKTEHQSASYYRDRRIAGWRESYVYKLPSGEIVAVYDDVTKRKELEERESELLIELKTIFENFPVGIIYLASNFNIISTNKFFNEFAGLREEDLAGKPCYEVVGEYAGDPAKKGIEKVCSFCKKAECFKTKRPTVIERPLGDKCIRVTTVPEFDLKGNITRFMEIVEDITERKQAEAEALRSSHLASLGELAAGVAHEINNPLNGIINYAQILSKKIKRDSKEQDIAKRIIKEGDRIANIVSSLLSFARDVKEKKHPVNIHDIIADSLILTEAQLRKDGIILKVSVSPDLPELYAQPQQIEQVLLNIISNARYALNQKYPGTHKNKIFEITGEKTTMKKRRFIRLTFKDRGTGIASENIDKIMIPFFSTKSSQGTGLGLSISHGIISDHGGKIVIESQEKKFTSVTVELPVKTHPKKGRK